MILNWKVEDNFADNRGAIVEVSASGEDVVERIHEIIAEGHAHEELKRLKNLKATEGIVLGHFERDGYFFSEYAFDLGMDEKWLRSLMPKSITEAAWGRK